MIPVVPAVAAHLKPVFRCFCIGLLFLCTANDGWGQILSNLPVLDKAERLEYPSAESVAKERELIDEIYEPELLLRVEPAQSRIIRTRYPVSRTAISHPGIVDIQVFDENEIEIIGKTPGETTMTFWFEIPGKGVQVLRYFVEVDEARNEQRRREFRYRQLQSRINELFPNSQVFLFPIDDKIIVRGQARDAREAHEIMNLLGRRDLGRRGFSGDYGQNDYAQRGFTGPIQPAYDDPFDDHDSDNFINLLDVPGEQQVMLKVRVAELVRDSNRTVGVDLAAEIGSFDISHILSGSGNLTGILNDGEAQFFLRAIASHGYGKILAEPTLVTISGKPAQFLAGGEFAVPTAVGIDGIGAATTSFRGFGTELSFTPTVLDKDLVRLEVAPSFSTLNADAAVGGIPGLNLRSVNTTVDLREGQWLAIAGLIQDEQGGQRSRLPFLGDLPFIGGLFSTQNTSRFETELVVLVSPELVHPLEREQVPLFLPGMEVTEPTDEDFFLRNLIEGYDGFHHRSTVWPEVQRQETGIRRSEFLNRFTGGTKRKMALHRTYISGQCGFSE